MTRTMRRTIIAATLAAVLATPATAHIPGGRESNICESKFWTLRHACATPHVAQEDLDPAKALVEPPNENIDALREISAAGLELALSVDEGS